MRKSNAYRAYLVRLRAARLYRGMTQAQAAKALGISQVRVSNMETGERRVDIIEANAFAKLYKKPLRWFVADS